MKNIYGFLILVLLSTLFAACGPMPVSSAYCVAELNYNKEVIPNGIYWPGQTIPDTVATGNSRIYIPCNYRNYIIAEKNDKGYGDWQDPIVVTFKGTRIDVYASAYWMLNQNESALREFIPFANKYTNVFNSSQDTSNNVNSSTTGWNDMLRENFLPTMNSITKQAIYNINNNYDSITGKERIFEKKITDALWINEDEIEIKVLQEEMGRIFQYDIATRIASTSTLFCGQGGGSKWADPNPQNAGEPGNLFNCDPVRIEITAVRQSEDQNVSASQSLIEANKQQYLAAYELYGDQTNCWLGIQNSINAAKDNPAPVIINIDANACNTQNPDGSQKPTTIVLPNLATPTPEPTVTVAP